MVSQRQVMEIPGHPHNSPSSTRENTASDSNVCVQRSAAHDLQKAKALACVPVTIVACIRLMLHDVGDRTGPLTSTMGRQPTGNAHLWSPLEQVSLCSLGMDQGRGEGTVTDTKAVPRYLVLTGYHICLPAVSVLLACPTGRCQH